LLIELTIKIDEMSPHSRTEVQEKYLVQISKNGILGIPIVGLEIYEGLIKKVVTKGE
jgi:hypothetical protein